MRQLMIVSIAVGLLGCASAAVADMDMLKKNNCIACHAVESAVFGPSFKAVAKKYADDATAPARLAAKIRAGGAGVWGESPMPPQPQVSEADAQTLAKYILSLK
ncbi:c-type cytochrome [Variovorax sp. RHLX14]|uniref:c-type cytochrome n=1 Tax=Variovorax sp. RHLX14 TaxID=1259731 RepID=UPI003F456336